MNNHNTNTNDVLVGIDFGTTNTVISIFSSNKSNILMDGVFKIIPSKIGKINNKIYCGNYIPISCKNIIHSFKTTIGENNIFNLDNDKYTNLDLLVIFFNHIKDLIKKNSFPSKNIDNSIKSIKAVITVPSNFNDKQRDRYNYQDSLHVHSLQGSSHVAKIRNGKTIIQDKNVRL